MIIVVRTQDHDTVFDTSTIYDLAMAVDQNQFWTRVTDLLDPYVRDNMKIEIIDTDSATITDLNIHRSSKQKDVWLAYSIRSGLVLKQIATTNTNTVIWSILYETYMAA